MTPDAGKMLLQSVKEQLERLQAQSQQEVSLILFEPGPNLSLEDVLLTCLYTRDHCSNGSYPAQSIACFRRNGESIEEFVFVSPWAEETREQFLKIAGGAGNCLGEWSRQFGISDAILGTDGPIDRWLKVMFQFVMNVSGFPVTRKWRLLNLVEESWGRYAVINDAIRCSLYAVDFLSMDTATSFSKEAASTDASIQPESDTGVITPDPEDQCSVRVCGKRLYLGNDTQISRLFGLLANPIGRVREYDEVQKAVDGVLTDCSVGSSPDETRKAQIRSRKAFWRLRDRIRKCGAGDHILIHRTDLEGGAELTMIRRHV